METGTGIDVMGIDGTGIDRIGIEIDADSVASGTLTKHPA
jgi:hypothetical protein